MMNYVDMSMINKTLIQYVLKKVLNKAHRNSEKDTKIHTLTND